MMVMDYLRLSTHSFKFIPQGLLPSELIKEITYMNNVTQWTAVSE